jgi:hypothetical protein
MQFNIGLTEDLFTPIGIDGAVTKLNPFFPSNDISPAADVNLNLSSISSKRDEMNLPILDKYKRMIDKPLDDEFLSSLELIDFDEFEGSGKPSSIDLSQTESSSCSELPMDGFRFEDYLPASSLASAGLNAAMSSFDEKSMFLPALDSTVDSEDSSAPPWVGEECTVGSVTDEDTSTSMDSPMPSVSSVSNSSPCSSSSSAVKRLSKGPRLSTVDRRLRKKDQNKTAAEKYRQKKRAERDELAQRQTTLQNQNRELKFELENFTFRLEQFKQLFVDVLQIPIPPSKSK